MTDILDELFRQSAEADLMGRDGSILDEAAEEIRALRARLAPIEALAARIKDDAETATAGPWRFVEDHPTNSAGHVNVADHFQEIAVLYGPDDVGQRSDGVWLDHPIRRANGRLIAAAPEMADAILAAGGE